MVESIDPPRRRLAHAPAMSSRGDGGCDGDNDDVSPSIPWTTTATARARARSARTWERRRGRKKSWPDALNDFLNGGEATIMHVCYLYSMISPSPPVVVILHDAGESTYLSHHWQMEHLRLTAAISEHSFDTEDLFRAELELPRKPQKRLEVRVRQASDVEKWRFDVRLSSR